MEKDRILLVDDEEDMLENCARLLRAMGYSPVTAPNGEEGLKIIEEEAPALVLSDLKMPGMGGIEFLHQVKKRYPDLAVIIFTAFGSIESAVEAIKEGAFDYLPKPFTSDQLKHSVERALKTMELARENLVLKRQLSENFRFENIIGQSQGIKNVIETIKKIAGTHSNVLILGESGTGKELVARSIHANSRRLGKPFVPLDCAALPEALIESELFGHEKGAFTGAHISREGIFETANTGTLFLDEIAELGMDLQSKLLRVLQERKIRKVGGRKEIDIDIRIISATNRDLRKGIEEKWFREELYFRLNVISVTLPPLRERLEDIPLLCEFFMKEYSASNDSPVLGLSREAMDLLKSYPWPGNIRELQNCLERAASFAEGQGIGAGDLPENISGSPDMVVPPFEFGGMNYREAKKKYMEVFERGYMENLLNKSEGSITRASEISGIPRMTIYRIMKKVNFKREN